MLGRRFLKGDAVAEGLETAHMVVEDPVGAAAVEVVRAEFLVGDAVAHDEEGNLEDVMAHGHDGLFVPAVPLDAQVPRLQGGAIGAASGEPTLNQGSAQIVVAVTHFPRPALAGTLVLPRTDRRPTGQMAGRGEAAHLPGGL